jgi:hypothetical protein
LFKSDRFQDQIPPCATQTCATGESGRSIRVIKILAGIGCAKLRAAIEDLLATLPLHGIGAIVIGTAAGIECDDAVVILAEASSPAIFGRDSGFPRRRQQQ